MQRHQFIELVRRHGEPAPGPVASLRLMLQQVPLCEGRLIYLLGHVPIQLLIPKSRQ